MCAGWCHCLTFLSSCDILDIHSNDRGRNQFFMTNTPQPSFDGLGIAPALRDILARARFSVPTPIQTQAIPVGIAGKDVVGIAQTGTGKTLAFAVPILQRLEQMKGRALVVCPTRELALQIDETFQRVGRALHTHTVVLMGGMSMGGQIQQLRRNPRVIVATPGRLLDHMQQRTVSLADVKIVVMDEADRMFDMGFMPAIKKIFEACPRERQTMLFSATMPPDIMKLAAAYMQLPVRVEVAVAGTTAERVAQELIFVKKEDKLKLLEKVLHETKGSILVFSRTKHGARKMTHALVTAGHTAAEIHSDRSLAQRRAALEGFKRGRFRVLVATDIAARGIDVKGIELVVNYDLPDSAEDYVHRIGRTGRAGMEGHAIAFATPDQRRDVAAIERLIRQQLPVKHVPELSVSLGQTPFRQQPDRSPRFQNQFQHKKQNFGNRTRGGSKPFHGHGNNVKRHKRTIM